MIDLLLILLLLALLLPLFGVFVLSGTVALLLKILFVVILVSLILNFVGARSNRNWW